MPRTNTNNIYTTSPRQIGHRLALTRKALGCTTTEMCHLMGSSTSGSAYTNYEMGRRRISIDHALALCDKCALTLDWIYRGRINELPEHLQKAIQSARKGVQHASRIGGSSSSLR